MFGEDEDVLRDLSKRLRAELHNSHEHSRAYRLIGPSLHIAGRPSWAKPAYSHGIIWGDGRPSVKGGGYPYEQPGGYLSAVDIEITSEYKHREALSGLREIDATRNGETTIVARTFCSGR